METKTEINAVEIKKNIRVNKSIFNYVNEQVKNFIKLFLETILDVEFEMYREGLTPKRYRQRNGYYRRSLLTSYGLIENLKVPRYRAIRFTNSLFKPWQRRWEKVEETIVKLFIQGESYRDIRRMVGELSTKW
ncbi:transposase [Melioribacteraceae bacterium 4301-Me]